MKIRIFKNIIISIFCVILLIIPSFASNQGIGASGQRTNTGGGGSGPFKASNPYNTTVPAGIFTLYDKEGNKKVKILVMQSQEAAQVIYDGVLNPNGFTGLAYPGETEQKLYGISSSDVNTIFDQLKASSGKISGVDAFSSLTKNNRTLAVWRPSTNYKIRIDSSISDCDIVYATNGAQANLPAYINYTANVFPFHKALSSVAATTTWETFKSYYLGQGG